jgi:hypothetical protein
VSRAADFACGYAPGGLSPRARRRENARRAGRLSGRARRKTAWARRGIAPGPGSRRLKLTYDHRQPSRTEFDRDYSREFPEPDSHQGAAMWQKGRQTCWELLMDTWRLRCARGQYCDTTKPRRARQLEARGRGRCEKTVQRHMRRLERLGYVRFVWIRTQVDQLDYLRVEWRLHRRFTSLNVLHPPGTENPGFAGGFSAVPQKPDPAINDLSPPPAAADVGPPDKPAERPGTEREDLESQIRFVQLKLDMSFGGSAQFERQRAELWRLKAQLRAIDELASDRRHPEGSDG